MGSSDGQRGRFIVVEGIDGCGKSTQVERLGEWLPSSGLMPHGASLLITREPGGTPLGQALRQLLLHPPEAAAPCSTAELLMFAADRAQHVENLIRPALEAGHWVLSDRFSASTLAYQGFGRGLSASLIEQLSQIACGGVYPDLSILCDIPVDVSIGRREHKENDTIEAGGKVFLDKVLRGFHAISSNSTETERWRQVDATQAVDDVFKDIKDAVLSYLSEPATMAKSSTR